MQTKKLIQSQFIVKITDIMIEHPEILKWTENGAELHLTNVDLFCDKVLPQYFRHSNFNSFIRQVSLFLSQLNIYSFNKTKKVAKSIWFKHEIFKRGNENNFFLVQRKRKFKELENYQERFEKQCEDLISQLNSKRQITAPVKEVIINLLEYKYVSHLNLKRMKCELDALHKDIKDSRNKKVHELASELKSNLLSSISQLTSESKQIGELISQNFLKNKEFSETKQIPDPAPNEIGFSALLGSVYGMSQGYPKSHSVTKEEPQQYYVSDEFKPNLRQYNSFHVFLEEFKSRKEQFTYDHKLYNPFHSQNSFMFLPSYIAGPSQLPFDARCSFQYQSVVNEHAESEQKKPAFDHFDESASISFVKDFSQDQDQMLISGN